MRTIQKGREPSSLTEYRLVPGANYDDYRDKDALRAALVSEQRGLCCYCLSQIAADGAAMKIEHFRSQRFHPTEQLDYSNLLASCHGNDGRKGYPKYCDTAKAEHDLSKNPANPLHNVEACIRYLSNGDIEATDPGFNSELNNVLNLNTPWLVDQRKSTLAGFVDCLPKRGALRSSDVKRWLTEWSGESTRKISVRIAKSSSTGCGRSSRPRSEQPLQAALPFPTPGAMLV